jgi:hypothetical protein
MSWADRSRWALEDKLPAILRDIQSQGERASEERAAEEDRYQDLIGQWRTTVGAAHEAMTIQARRGAALDGSPRVLVSCRIRHRGLRATGGRLMLITRSLGRTLSGVGLAAALLVSGVSPALAQQGASLGRGTHSNAAATPSYTQKQLKQACISAALQIGVRCHGKGRVNELCRNDWGLGAREGDLGYDRRGLLRCGRFPGGFGGFWERY